jgi:hypothetical protein
VFRLTSIDPTDEKAVFIVPAPGEAKGAGAALCDEAAFFWTIGPEIACRRNERQSLPHDRWLIVPIAPMRTLTIRAGHKHDDNSW